MQIFMLGIDIGKNSCSVVRHSPSSPLRCSLERLSQDLQLGGMGGGDASTDRSSSAAISLRRVMPP